MRSSEHKACFENLQLRATADEGPPRQRDRHSSQHDSSARIYKPDPARSGGDDGRPEAGHDPDDVIRQVAGNSEPVQGGVQVAGGQVEVGAGDAQPMVGRCYVGPPVALRAARASPRIVTR